ncbi:acid protease [Viridothelium virens]|uniref:Acid protease n=1 Tax=Viridothelium virens TaxID=1048519 RepID=A0A6A6HE15_VIRVR|nr:acid protease [Viridothelium virens]
MGRRSLSLSCVAVVLLLLVNAPRSRGSELEPRASATPAPISFDPDENWDGIDGAWNSFTLSVGTPSQYVRVLPSTADQQIWTVQPLGCYQSSDSDCENHRGWFFDFNKSTSWQDNGLWDLWIETNLGYYGNANYGYDTVGLGGVGQGGPSLPNQTVAALAVNDFYLGVFGLNPKPTNFTNFSDPSPSYMEDLRTQNLIPSKSFGYSAGAKYRGFTGTLASLTLGGYDAARFEPNNLTFVLGPDNERDIVVGIRSINVTGNGTINANMLSEPMDAYIDSTVPQIWLPLDACRKFEDTFGLVFDQTTELYLVNDSLHTQLLQQDPSITFTLGVGPSGGDTVDIVLPYSSFDLTALPPYQGLTNQSRYFPLRRAANETQYTLGRTFLQEAYLIVEWENANFSVSQCVWPNQMEKNIIAIQPPTDGSDASQYTNASSSPSSSLSTGAIIGIVIGAVVVISILLALLVLHNRRKHRRDSEVTGEKGASPMTEQPDDSRVFPKAELPAVEPVSRHGKDKAEHANERNPFDELNYRPNSAVTPTTPGSPGSPSTGFFTPHLSRNGLMSLSGPGTPSDPAEADNKEREIYEMPGDAPSRQEMDAPAVGEKQAMMLRERIYNGVDPLPSPTSGNGRDSLTNRGSNTLSNRGSNTLSNHESNSLSNRESNTFRSSTLASSPVQPSDIISPVHSSDRGPLTPVHLEDRGPISPLQPEFSGFRFSFEGQPSEPSDLSELAGSTTDSSLRR